jgi:radical SAM superfamily enzyme YgiQ (UPF0313 family)
VEKAIPRLADPRSTGETSSIRAISPAKSVSMYTQEGFRPMVSAKKRVLTVDLNNFSTFPTLAVGLLVGSLRREGHDVRVLCPLAFDVPAAERERRESWLDHAARRINMSTAPWFVEARELAVAARRWWIERPHPTVLREFARALEDGPDVVLLSAYLQHFHTVKEIAALAGAKKIPVVLGGPMFNVEETAQEWRRLPGLAAVVGAESDRDISSLVVAACDGADLRDFKGVTLPIGETTEPAPPLRRLDDTPVADFIDFPWDRYRVRIVPIMTGRGCQWSKCTFCSDIASVSGRSFRTRSVQNVLLEIEEQSKRHATTNFMFLDLKLNSDPSMIRGIASQVQKYVQGAEWIGTVHVDRREDNGLSRRDLLAAVAGGMRRVSFGLESGSQRLLDLIKKNSSVEGNSDFIRNAFEAGLSVRCTMFAGYPGETPDDIKKTAVFIERHTPYIDRIRFNRFSVLYDTPIYAALKSGHGLPAVEVTKAVDRLARLEHRNRETELRGYRRAKARALKAVYEVNRRPVRPTARQFDGLM